MFHNSRDPTGNVNHDCHSLGRNIHVARSNSVDAECCLARAAWMLQPQEWQSWLTFSVGKLATLQLDARTSV
ncbi:hypothetical protein Y032_0397g701 [Ancylostoma ceylanicum]|uniref:Uncharacterized protein n=1 Tax=Ancylostoma ceylanicum TaxID=53326 RepID=A0A016RRI1_9BILA|nr:hypothetical protein Y032_0397g701 [Ancylostoma ceylanicum]